MSFASAKLQSLLPRLPRVCVALAGADMLDQAERLQPEFPFLEFRFDTVERPEEAVYDLGRFLKQFPRLIAIATCRRSANGGRYDGTPRDEVHLLTQAAAVGAQVVDLSLETAEETATDTDALSTLRRGRAALLLSWHDFRQTPSLESVYARMANFRPDLYKIVPTAQSLRDSLQVLQFLRSHSKGTGGLVAMAMGTAGIPTRVLGPANGSLFTFASAASGRQTAPGQVDARTLRDLYRIDRITPDTRIYGVFGKPITGSKSPVMLNTAFQEASLDAVYLPFEADTADLLFAAAVHLPLAGASVTMPLKELILPQLKGLDALARGIGAVNTLRHDVAGELSGFNTDARGISAPLEERISLQGGSALVLGAGGAARSAIYALGQKGVRVSILNRSPERARVLAEETGSFAITREEAASRHFNVILNATSFGMASAAGGLAGGNDAAPFTAAEMNCDLFFDLVYYPIETELMKAARARGIPVLSGVEMFLAQGAEQFAIWTGLEAPAQAMRSAVLKALASEETEAATTQIFGR